MGLPIGSSRITADGAIGTSGAPIRVYSVILVSGGGGASTLSLKNGTSTSGTEYDSIVGTTSVAVRVNYAGGILFPGGCFADVDANISYAVIVWEKQASA